MGHAAPVPDMSSSQVRDLSASHWRDLRQDKDAAIYWSESSFQLKKCYTLALRHTQGNSRFLHHPLLQQRRPHEEATGSGFQHCSKSSPSPSKHPPPVCKGRSAGWAWTALALTSTSVHVRPRKPLASPARSPSCSCCRPSTSPTLQWCFLALVLIRACS